MTKLCIKLLVEADSAIESAFPKLMRDQGGADSEARFHEKAFPMKLNACFTTRQHALSSLIPS